MSVGDVESIGAHCQVEFCRQLDFLPFRCESCKGKFCLDHRTETAHQCSKAGAWARARAGRDDGQKFSLHYAPPQKPTIMNHDRQCAEPSCKTLVETALTPGVHCQTCNRTYCLKHRMGEDHDCAKLEPIGARPADAQAQAREKGLAALAKLKAWGAGKRAQVASPSSEKKSSSFIIPISGPSRFSSTGTAKKPTAVTGPAALNALKRTAKGDEKIPVDKRVYLHVEASADTTTAKFPTGKFFYSVDWSVGRVLDIAAKALQVQNVNNRGGGEEEKLRVFHVEGGRLLEFREKMGDMCKSGNTIVLLRGVGPGVPDLIDL